MRRLVSEGTRPRLPWAPRLRAFQKDPRPVLELLELLKDDPELYVRRSVANNLNDIGKDHPALLTAVAKRWLRGASRGAALDRESRAAFGGETRRRSARWARWVMGQGRGRQCVDKRVAPPRVKIGGSVTVSFTLVNKQTQAQRVMVDLVVHFVKARGTGAKTFKMKALDSGAACARVRVEEDRAAAAHYPQTLSGRAQGGSAAQWPARGARRLHAAALTA